MAHEVDAPKDDLKGATKAEKDRAVEDAEEGTRAASVELRTSRTSSRMKAMLWKNLMWVWRHKM